MNAKVSIKGWALIAVLLVSFGIHSRINAQPLIYGYRLYNSAGTAPETALGVASDVNTNAFALGGYTAATTINGTLLSNPGGWPNIFVCKFQYGLTNSPKWTKGPVTDYTISTAKINCDFNGNSFVAGSFEGTNLTFGALILTNYATDHSPDIFLTKYDANGNTTFLTQAGGTGADVLGDAKSDSSGNSYLTGTFQSPVFAAGTSSLTLSASSGGDVFVAKYNSSGGLTWFNQGSYANGRCMAVDLSGNCYVGGDVTGAALFNGVSPSSPTTTNFLAKYNSAGSLAWVAGNVTVGKYIMADKGQNIYTTGTFTNTVQIGSITLTNAAPSTIYVAKYDPNGNALWAAQVPGLGADAVTGITYDSQSNCWISGYLAPPGAPTNTVSILVRYSPSGTINGLTQFNSQHVSMAGGIAANFPVNFNILVAGTYSTNFSMGTSTVLTNGGNTDVFAAWVFVSPNLTVTTSSTNIVSSWPAADGGQFTLQTSADLSSWSAASSGSTVNGQVYVTNPITSGAHFFRLKKN